MQLMAGDAMTLVLAIALVLIGWWCWRTARASKDRDVRIFLVLLAVVAVIGTWGAYESILNRRPDRIQERIEHDLRICEEIALEQLLKEYSYRKDAVERGLFYLGRLNLCMDRHGWRYSEQEGKYVERDKDIFGALITQVWELAGKSR